SPSCYYTPLNFSSPQNKALMQMEYLDVVVNESLRLERISKASVEMNGVTIPKGTAIMIPVYTLHCYPALLSEPEILSKQREQRQHRSLYLLLFRAGPRNRIGMLLALLIMKLAIVEVLQNFSFVTCKETEIAMVLANDFFTRPNTPIKLKLEPRASAANSLSS
uniref:Uncharacterized protein n=1 Tax=Seriola lalandi dorsalis TaxID=1841481 RepID=A0A3B4W9Q2_SERLL